MTNSEWPEFAVFPDGVDLAGLLAEPELADGVLGAGDNAPAGTEFEWPEHLVVPLGAKFTLEALRHATPQATAQALGYIIKNRGVLTGREREDIFPLLFPADGKAALAVVIDELLLKGTIIRLADGRLGVG